MNQSLLSLAKQLMLVAMQDQELDKEETKGLASSQRNHFEVLSKFFKLRFLATPIEEAI